MKYTRILVAAAALLAVSTLASQAATPPAATAPTAGSTTAAPAGTATVAPAESQDPISGQAAAVKAAPEPTAGPISPLPEETPATWGDAKAGQAKAGACAACHGSDGNSTVAQYPRLAGQHERYIAKQLKAFKNGDRESPIMQPMAAPLSAQDMRDIGAYFATQHGQAGVADESPVAAGDNAGKKYWQVGERVFRAGNAKNGVPACLACHGPTGRGNPGPAYPSLGGQHGSYTLARMKFFREGSDKARAIAPVMVEISKRLTDEEIQGVSTYVEGLHPAAVASKAE